MATTPEGWVKKIVKEMLDLHPCAYYHMPVQNGMGAPSLDFICCIDGRYVAIETKAPGKTMTDRQELTAKEIEAGGGEVIRDVGTDWLSLIRACTRMFSDEKLQIPSGMTCEWVRWERYFKNARGQDAHQPAT